MRRCSLVAVVLVACGDKGPDALDRDVDMAMGRLRRLQESGEAPLNQCRQRLTQSLRRVRRGPVTEKLSAKGPVVCAIDDVFTDCADISSKLVDACGQFTLNEINSPSGKADRKRFLDEVEKGKQDLEKAAQAAETAKASMIYRERCTWTNESGIYYENVETKGTSAFMTVKCDADVTLLDDNNAGTESVVASVTVKSKFTPGLQKSEGEISNANNDARVQALRELRAAIAAKIP